MRALKNIVTVAILTAMVGCAPQPIRYQIATLQTSDDTKRIYSVDIDHGNDFLFKFDSNGSSTASGTIVITVANLDDHVLEFRNFSNNVTKVFALKPREECVIYNGSVTRRPDMFITKNGKYGFRFSVENCSFPLKVDLVTVDKYR